MKRTFLSLLALGSFAVLSAAPVSYIVSVDTSSIAPGTAGYIDFQFNQANGSTSLPATASIAGFTSTGYTFDSGVPFTLGGVSGSLFAPPLVFDNTGGGANVFDQGVTEFGSNFSFVVTLDGDALSTAAADGSQLFVFLWDTSFVSLLGPTNGIAGIVINGDTTVSTEPAVGYSTIEPTPEPGTMVTLGFGGLMLLVRRFRK